MHCNYGPEIIYEASFLFVKSALSILLSFVCITNAVAVFVDDDVIVSNEKELVILANYTT